MRRFTPVELAVGFALGASVLAVAIPAFVRELHASRFVEPVEGLTRIGAAAIAHADLHGTFPETVAPTPETPPRGTKEVDPPGTWDAPTWQALGFRPTAEGVPHAYAFSFESSDDPTTFTARARGDLDGDGVLSTFEIHGYKKTEQPAALTPGMYVEAELE